MKLLYFRCFIGALLLCLPGTGVLAQSVVTPATALKGYLDNADKTYHWEVKDSLAAGDVMAYTILLTSQKWREHTWTHQLTVMVPKEHKYDGALLFITGGSNNTGGLPNWTGEENRELRALALIAQQNKAITAVLRQTPNQPLYDGLTEDALISYTLHNFKKDHDFSWPLLFPMVKSATAAMTAVQEFSSQRLNHSVGRFVVSGASKRGWTTWLTGAVDQRVKAIAPMVIDMLNMPVSMNYQIKVWKDYSVQIEDYVKLGLVQDIGTNSSNELTAMIDPYAYRRSLTMPKMIIMGTNDEYWPIDNIKNYYDSIPGQNLIHYVPNAGHGLGDGAEAMQTLSAFFGYTLSGAPYPVCTWKISSTKRIARVAVKATADRLVDVVVWHADSPDMDFRNDKWVAKPLGIKHKSVVNVEEDFPVSGYRAFYVDLKYQDSRGMEYTESTRVFMTDDKKIL